MEKVVLIFPPGWSVHSPYLALPLLASVLRAHGYVVEVWDLGVQFYEHILSPSVLEEMLSRVEKRDVSDPNLTAPERAALGIALVTGPQVIEQVERAMRCLRTREALLDHETVEWAMGVVSRALNIVSAAYPGLCLSLERIEVRPYSRTSTYGVLQASSDARRNPLIEWYQTVLSPRVRKEAANLSLVGVSVSCPEQLIPAITLARLVRKDLARGVPIVLGGNYISRLASRWDRPHPFLDLVDAIVIGEGEHALLSLLSLGNWRDSAQIEAPNIIYVRQGKLFKGPKHYVDLDSLPTPDFSGLPLDKYLAPDCIFPLFTSRGCRHRCAFCGIPAVSGPFRRRSVDLVVRDIKALRDKFGASYFTFVDETLEPEVLSELARELVRGALDIRWYGETRFDPRLDDRLVADMARSGARMVQLGLESYSSRVLGLMRKGVRAEDVKPILIRLLRHGIAFHLFAFLGFPGETEEEAKRTLVFLEEMMDLAVREYGNMYCSNGTGLFHLDPDSLVAREPHMFGVTILGPRPEEDLPQEYDYKVTRGLAKSEARKVLERHVGQDCFTEAWEKIGRLPTNRVLPTRERWEEWNFLRYCYHEIGIQPRNSIPRLPNFDGSQLSPWCSARLLPLDPLSTRPSGPVVLLYGGRSHRLLSLSPVDIPVLVLLSQGVGPAQILDATQKGHLEGLEHRAVASCLHRLSRSGVIPLARTSVPEAVLAQAVVPIREPGVSLVSLDDGQFVLVDVDAERVIRTDPEGALVWLLIDGQRSLGDIGACLAERGMDFHWVTTAITQLGAHGLVRFASPLLGLEEGQSLASDQLSVATFVRTAAELIGQQLLTVVLFGSRARGTAGPNSDYDCLLVVTDEPDDVVAMNVLFAAREAGSIDVHIETLSNLKRTLRLGDPARLNMILEGRVLYGYLGFQLQALARKAVRKFGLSPAPNIGKGCWLARNTFPPDTPYYLYRSALKRLASLSPEASPLRRAAVTDAFLRSLVATRIQGNLDHDRAYLLELLRKYVLDADGWHQLERIIQEGERPERICRFVGGVLRAKYGKKVPC